MTKAAMMKIEKKDMTKKITDIERKRRGRVVYAGDMFETSSLSAIRVVPSSGRHEDVDEYVDPTGAVMIALENARYLKKRRYRTGKLFGSGDHDSFRAFVGGKVVWANVRWWPISMDMIALGR